MKYNNIYNGNLTLYVVYLQTINVVFMKGVTNGLEYA